jgi:hypothetical protein
MKRRYLTLTIRQLKVKLSHLSRTSFRITRKFFKSRLGINKRDWSRLTKAEIIRVLNYYYGFLAPNRPTKVPIFGGLKVGDRLIHVKSQETYQVVGIEGGWILTKDSQKQPFKFLGYSLVDYRLLEENRCINLVKSLLSGYQFQLTSPGNFTSVLPKLRTNSGQQWRLTDQADIGELSDSGVSMYYAKFQKIYPHGHQMDIWDNSECFVLFAELGKQLCVYVSKRYFNVSDFLEKIENEYTQLSV